MAEALGVVIERLLARVLGPRPADEDEAMRRYVVVAAGLFFAATVLPLLAALFAVDPVARLPRTLGLGGAIILGANVLWLRFASSRAVAAATTAILHILVFVAVTANAGARGPTLVLVTFLPAMTAVLHGQRAAWIDAGLLLAYTAALLWWDAAHGLPAVVPLEVWPTVQMVSLAIAFGLTILAVHAFQRSQARQNAAVRAARDAALAASTAKSRFLSTMSHELRTPMVGVLGAADLLAQRQLDADAQHLLSVLRRAANTQLRLIGDILDLSRIEANALTLESVPVSIAALIDEVATIFQPAALKKGLDLQSTVDPSVPAFIAGDPLRLHQILSNLVNNAIKFTPSGSIRLSASTLVDPPRVRLEVTDTGIGIAPDRLHHVLEDFTQADESTSRRFGGSGLGLAICKRLCDAMGADLQITSALGQGSTFTIVLPAHPSAPRAASSAASASIDAVIASSAGPGIIVLLADDDPVNRLILGEMLRRLSHTVVEAFDGADAISRLTTYRVDLVILDMHMPGLDGPATARSIRELTGPLAAVPIIGLTADVTAEHLAEFARSGVTRVLSKPIGQEALRQAIDQEMAEHRLFAAGR